jgi:hypothetical protein
MDTTTLLAIMAAILEAGDRAAKGSVPHGDERTERPVDYAERAKHLLVAAGVASELFIVPLPFFHRRLTEEERAKRQAAQQRYAEIRARWENGEKLSDEDDAFMCEWVD